MVVERVDKKKRRKEGKIAWDEGEFWECAFLMIIYEILYLLLFSITSFKSQKSHKYNSRIKITNFKNNYF